MFYLEKKLEISGSHTLDLNYQSKCNNLHGHNWVITIYCKSENLNSNGMIIDFTEIKENIKNKLDHRHLNDLFDFNPTAENLAKWICDHIDSCYKVRVQESEGNVVVYEL